MWYICYFFLGFILGSNIVIIYNNLFWRKMHKRCISLVEQSEKARSDAARDLDASFKFANEITKRREEIAKMLNSMQALADVIKESRKDKGSPDWNNEKKNLPDEI